MKKSFGKRLLSGLTSALLAVTYAVPNATELFSNAATGLGSQDPVDDLTMLVGENPKDPDFNPYSFSSMKEAIDKYNSDYLLGIASQFCVFMSDDFLPEDSDAEGRVAVGGSLYMGPNKTRDEYEIGNGDFNTHESLESLIDNTGFAHAIIDGDRVESLIPLSWKDYELNGSYSKIPKKFWITTGVQPTGLSDNYKNYGPNFGDYDDYFYTDSKAFDVKAQFESLKDRSKQLGKKKSQFQIGENSTADTLELEYIGPENADTVYLTLSNEEGDISYDQFMKAKNVVYKNIPKLSEPRKVVDNDGSYTTWEDAYIVVNIDCDSVMGEGGTEVYVSNQDKFTSINGTWISTASKNGDVDVKNNHFGVTSLLYNYYTDADKDFTLYLGKNFQGTIFAPNADVRDTPGLGNGHLSGALIAKSFVGKTEFGYRPFTGPISMLGTKPAVRYPS